MKSAVLEKQKPDHTLLIVEDNPLNMKLFQDIFESSGYQTLSSTNGRDAFKQALLTPPDLMILDIQLPEMSGVEVAKLFRQHPKLKHIPIVAVTALAMKGDEAIILQSGCDAYVTKPISIEKLLGAVRTYL